MYKITFYFQSPLSFTTRPLFDSILAYAYVKEYHKFKTQKLFYSEDELIDFSNLPICTYQDKNYKESFFLASMLLYGDVISSEMRWRKRWDNKNDSIVDFGKSKRRINVSSGEFKSYDIPIETHDIKQGYFYFESEDVNEVEKLVAKNIFAIGKKTSQGYGMYKNFSIIKSDDFEWTEKIVRPIPTEFVNLNKIKGSKLKCIDIPCYPPYWSGESKQCFIPIS